MTLVLDAVAELVRLALGVVFPASWAGFLSIPVTVLAVIIGLRLFVRTLLVPVARFCLRVAGCVSVVAGAVVLLPEAAIASLFRRGARRPPAAVYNVGDAVASGVAALGRAIENAHGPVSRLARINGIVIVVLAAAWIWWWNTHHCPEVATQPATCVRPVTAWWSAVTGK